MPDPSAHDFRAPDDTPLVHLATQRRLPRHQYMDRTTLRWIVEHRPTGLSGRPVEQLPASFAQYALVPPDAYAQPRVLDSIHGLRHGARVAILGAHLARLSNLTRRETLEIVLAAAMHDCRRLHDQHDPGHGGRAARWFAERYTTIMERLPSQACEAQMLVVATAMELHDVDYADFTDEQRERYERAPAVSDVVKTADALDRYRLPRLAWWPNPDLLRIVPPSWLFRYAFDLMVATEGNRLDGMSNERAVAVVLAEETQ